MPQLDPERFADPPKAFRNAPFWALNDRLDPRELVRQIALMDEQGWGGFFMHARIGLETAYLSDQWMNCIRACVEAARKRGMQAWLYDEDRWPSGFAGGAVPARSARYRAKTLNCAFNDQRIARFRATMPGAEPRDAETVQLHHDARTPVDLQPRECDLCFTTHHAVIGHPTFSGWAYVDWLDPEVIRAFLQSTHERYADLFAGDFGRAVPGVFTDEPMLRVTDPGQSGHCLPWTDELPDIFWSTYGYDLLPHLPALFFDDGENPALVRHRFWRLVLDRFIECFTKPYASWCAEHGLELTGHFMAEDTLVSQIECIAAAMPHYEYMQRPGIDFLTRTLGRPDDPPLLPGYRNGGVVLARQCTSVAHQLGKKRTLSELYGCCGHNLTCEDRRWIGDWHLIHGINAFCPHLWLYSMRGCRKRDYPPALSHQQPYWRYTQPVELYQARLCYALSRGRRVTDLLVLHPMGSAWATYTPANPDRAQRIGDALHWISLWLCEIQRDFDYGDETILRRHGRVEDGVLAVGEARYRTVLIPPSTTWETTTVELLAEFQKTGGKLLAVPPLPACVDCEPSAELKRLLRKAAVVPARRDALADALGRAARPEVSIRDRHGERVEHLWCHHRRDGDLDLLFLANVDRERPAEAVVTVSWSGGWQEWDALSGERRDVLARAKGPRNQIQLTFAPSQSRLLVCDRARKPKSSRGPAARRWKRREIDGGWRVERQDPNALTLDRVRWRDPDSGEWEPPVHHLQGPRGPARPAAGDPFAVCYEFELTFAPEKKRPFAMALENPKRWSIKVNGRAYRNQPKGQYRDIAFVRFDLTGKLRKGTNTIELASKWSPDVEVEPIYLLGDFHVETQDRETFRLAKPDTRSDPSDLVAGGLPFFAGDVDLSNTFALPKRRPAAVRVAFDRLDAVLAVVFVNGQEAGRIFWRPFTLDITEFVRPGANRLTVRLSTSLHNLLGPHHCGREVRGVHPGSFADFAHYDPRYFFVPLGLAGARVEYA